jgi:DNA-binding FrmR family transcriptional regulator
MAHTVRDKTKLLRRVNRIIGQVEAVRRGLEDEQDCTDLMQLIAAAHGAMNSLMAEVVEGHVRYHMVDPDRRPTSREARAAQELIDVVRSYVK